METYRYRNHRQQGILSPPRKRRNLTRHRPVARKNGVLVIIGVAIAIVSIFSFRMQSEDASISYSSLEGYLPSPRTPIVLGRVPQGKRPTANSTRTSQFVLSDGAYSGVPTDPNRTLIVAVADETFKEIAVVWYDRMTSLGYSTHLVACSDKACYDHLEARGYRVEHLLESKEELHKGRPQQYRRRIYGTRWVFTYRLLQQNYNVLITDVDNIYVRYKPLSDMEETDRDVFQAYSGNYPVRFQSMGFTVCGGMVWIRASPGGIKFVERILQECDWLEVNKTHARCDDQQVVNRMFFENHWKLEWTHSSPSEINSTFWKPVMKGIARATGHTFAIWDANEAYRGPIDGVDGQCPKNPWVAMPWRSLRSKDPHGLTPQSRLQRVADFYTACLPDVEVPSQYQWS